MITGHPNTTDLHKSSIHVEAEVGELSTSVKQIIDNAIAAYDTRDFAKARKFIANLPNKIKKESATVKKLILYCK